MATHRPAGVAILGISIFEFLNCGQFTFSKGKATSLESLRLRKLIIFAYLLLPLVIILTLLTFAYLYQAWPYRAIQTLFCVLHFACQVNIVDNQYFTEYAPMPSSSNPATEWRVVSKQGSSKQDGGAMARTVEAGRVSPLITVAGYQSLQVIISLPSSGAPRQPPACLHLQDITLAQTGKLVER